MFSEAAFILTEIFYSVYFQVCIYIYLEGKQLFVLNHSRPLPQKAKFKMYFKTSSTPYTRDQSYNIQSYFK